MPSATSDDLQSYYDAVPYDSHPFPQTTPEHLEALAFLFGLDAPDPATARVLELGCAAGGNLIGFAARHPQAKVLGIDLSSVQVAQGVQAVEQAGLTNLELRAMDLSQIDASLGSFDFILCHGVYSWVPESVQQDILRVCSRNLAPNGVAYVSYNVYPGWKAREIVRDAMVLRGAPRDAPDEKLSYARGMLEFLEQSARDGSVLKTTLAETMPLIRSGNTSYLLHEFLEPCNAPCYLKEFAARAGSQGLAYLADAEPATMFVQNYGEKVREPLLRECGGSQLLMEQYLDFLVNRTFRQSLLVKLGRAAGIRYRLDADRLRRLHFAGSFRRADGETVSMAPDEEPCVGLRDVKLTLRQPAQKALASMMDDRYPASASVEELLQGVAERTGQPRAAIEQSVMAMLEEMVILGAVRIRCRAAAIAAEVAEKPLALACIRQSPSLPLTAGGAAGGTNQWHEQVPLAAVERCLLPRIDGAHSAAQLTDFLYEEAASERIRFIKDGETLKGEQALREFSAQQVMLALRDLRKKGFLVA